MAATFSTERNQLSISADVGYVASPRTATMNSLDAAPSPCPSSTEEAEHLSGFLDDSDVEPVVEQGAGPLVLAPKLDILSPRLCTNSDDSLVADVMRRVKPVSVAELSSGRFALESEGTTPFRNFWQRGL